MTFIAALICIALEMSLILCSQGFQEYLTLFISTQTTPVLSLIMPVLRVLLHLRSRSIVEIVVCLNPRQLFLPCPMCSISPTARIGPIILISPGDGLAIVHGVKWLTLL